MIRTRISEIKKNIYQKLSNVLAANTQFYPVLLEKSCTKQTLRFKSQRFFGKGSIISANYKSKNKSKSPNLFSLTLQAALAICSFNIFSFDY